MKTLFQPPPRPPLPPLQQWTIELQGRDAEVPAIIRLRKFLKMAGRSYGLRCVRITGQGIAQSPVAATVASQPVNMPTEFPMPQMDAKTESDRYRCRTAGRNEKIG